MRIIAVIPARYAAARFPGKLMQDLGGKPVIVQTYRTVCATHLFDEVLVATDDIRIAEAIEAEGGKVFMSKKEHSCGSDRIAEAVMQETADVVVNVQGDEPFIHGESLKSLIDVFHQDVKNEIALASLMVQLTDPEAIQNPNNVKVIVDDQQRAMYFSRLPIPYYRDAAENERYYKHIGIYAFRREALLAFSESEMTPLEKAEKIECIRYLEQGKKMQMVVTEFPSIGIDTPEDLVQAQRHLNAR